MNECGTEFVDVELGGAGREVEWKRLDGGRREGLELVKGAERGMGVGWGGYGGVELGKSWEKRTKNGGDEECR